jgi:DNA-binding response OmpR family regulator
MKKIFFVHDQQESPAARENFLEMAGFEVVMMKGSNELYVALQDEQPSLILMDILIEGRNGFEVARELHERLPRRRFPIVLCSRIYRARRFRELALKCGASDFILQPIQLDDFLRRVNRVLDEWRPAGSEDLERRIA